jgi:hypothetical protein
MMWLLPQLVLLGLFSAADSEAPLSFEPGSLGIFAIADGNGWVGGERRHRR